MWRIWIIGLQLIQELRVSRAARTPKTTAKEVISISDCAEKGEDDVDGTFLHRARVLFSLTDGQGFENGGVVITDEVNMIILFAFLS